MRPIDLPRATSSRAASDGRSRSAGSARHDWQADAYDEGYDAADGLYDEPGSSWYPEPDPRPAPRRRAPRSHYRKRREGRGITVIALLVIAAIVGGGVWMWLNRTVSVSVNGERTDVRAGSTLEQIVESEGLSLKPGNLVSVSGNVLTEGGGDAFSATVNGEQLDAAGRDAFRAEGNEEISLGDGRSARSSPCSSRQTRWDL